MKITLTGAAGKITKPLALQLIDAGHVVTIVGRDVEHLQPLIDKGALVAEGNIEDKQFVHEAFRHADVVYTMIPAPYHLAEWVKYGRDIAQNYADAIRAHRIKKVVNLSTYGAHLTSGNGILQSIAQLERVFETLENTEVINLRAGFFYANFYTQIPAVKEHNFLGANYGPGSSSLPLVHTNDIADVAFEAITTDHLKHNNPYYIVSDVRSLDEIAEAIGKAVDQDLKWTSLSDEALRGTLSQGPFPKHLVDLYIELGQQIASQAATGHYFQNAAKFPLGKVKLHDFAQELEEVYAHP